jgi:hypothetical protein
MGKPGVSKLREWKGIPEEGKKDKVQWDLD